MGEMLSSEDVASSEPEMEKKRATDWSSPGLFEFVRSSLATRAVGHRVADEAEFDSLLPREKVPRRGG